MGAAAFERAVSRRHDLVVFGATGYTGALVAAALARRAPAGLRWAIAGREEATLERVRRRFAPAAAIVVADAGVQRSLDALASATRVVVSTVGPFARHGTSLLAACAAHGTDYADVTGEPLWMRASIDAFDRVARADGVRIVHACGFDSVPSDLGTFLLQRTALERHGRACDRIVHVVERMAGGVSGGTVASALDLAETVAADPNARRALADPELLAPGGARSGDPRGPWWPTRHPGVRGWTAPFVMAGINGRVVRRTRHLLGEPWGASVAYVERLGVASWLHGAAVSAVTLAGAGLMRFGPGRAAVRAFAPSPGDGPSDDERRRGAFRTRLVGQLAGSDERVVVRVEADVDPGYEATARMLAEVGLGLATGDFDRVAHTRPRSEEGATGGAGSHANAGVVTPAFVGGMRLIERLGEVGVRFVVEAAAVEGAAIGA